MSATTAFGAEVNSIEEEIKLTFNLYKKDIKQSPSSLGKYFSKNVNELWLGFPGLKNLSFPLLFSAQWAYFHNMIQYLLQP